MARLPIACAVCLCLSPMTAHAQSVIDRTPNLAGGWTGSPGAAYFNFLHRFTRSAAPERQVSNSPTFLLGYAPFRNTLFALNYSTRSDVAARFPNEWEFFARRSVLKGVAVEAAYNNAAESLDGELSITRALRRITLLGAIRGFSHAYDTDTARVALAGGAVLQVTRFISLAGDVATLLNRSSSEQLAWGGALQIAIPSTPHSLSLQVTNTNTGTLEGASRGESGHRYGFEFTIPLHFSRFKGTAASSNVGTVPPGATQVVFKNLTFMPSRVTIARGTTVSWQNQDQLTHTVTAADKSWTSPLLQPGAVFTHTFDQPGTYEITCTPHPFMKMTVEVK